MAAKRVFQITDIFYHYRRWENSTTLKPISHINVEAYFGCAYGMLAYAFRESNTPEENYEILCAYKKYSWLTNKYYHALSAREKAKIVLPDELQKNLFRQIIINNSVTDKEFRFFRAITWLPRKILIRYRKFRKLGQISKLNHRKQ
jgi:hypothetical protein